jgi:hypothetical protein
MIKNWNSRRVFSFYNMNFLPPTYLIVKRVIRKDVNGHDKNVVRRSTFIITFLRTN